MVGHDDNMMKDRGKCHIEEDVTNVTGQAGLILLRSDLEEDQNGQSDHVGRSVSDFHPVFPKHKNQVAVTRRYPNYREFRANGQRKKQNPETR
jgi:hypothetical protein